MEKHERLKHARERAGYKSASAAARALRMKEPTYLGHENGSRDFGDDDGEAYAKKFRVSLTWLMLGEEHSGMLEDLVREPLRRPAALGESDGKIDYKPVLPGASPELDVRAGAGEGLVGPAAFYALPRGGSYDGHEVLSEWVFPANYLRQELKARPGNTIVMEVQGDSMEPTLSPGDRVIVDLSQNRLGPDGAIYLISYDDSDPQVKRIQTTDDEDGRIRVASDNPAVKDRHVMSDRLRIYGRVIGRVSRL